MSTEPTESTHNETAVDDRAGERPFGGFAPLADAPTDLITDDATMPPAPVDESTVHGVSQVEPDELVPSTSPWASLSELTETEDEPDDEAGNVDENDPWSTSTFEPPSASLEPSPVESVGSSGSVVFFGEGSTSPSESPWNPMDDVDLIMPIEPARLGEYETPAIDTGDAPWFAVEEGQDAPGDAVVHESIAHSTVLLGSETAHQDAEVASLTKLVATRLTRALVRPVTRVKAFVDDDAGSHTTLAPPAGSITVLAGSELEGAISAADSRSVGFDGVSVELGTPHPVSLGLRIPVCLVTAQVADAPVVSEIGGLTVTAVDGRIDVEAVFDNRVVGIAADDISGACTWLADAANDRIESQNRRFDSVTVDSLGAIRIETSHV